MNRIIFLLMLVFCASSQAIEKQPQNNNPVDLKNFPTTLKYTAVISEKTNISESKKHKVKVSYFAKNSDLKALYVESFKRVKIVKNQMDLTLGKGVHKKARLQEKIGITSLQELFANNAEVEMQINIDGVLLYPKIGILPAGHSQESTLFLEGNRPSDNDKHWKGFERKSTKTFFQAVELTEHDYNIYHPENIRTNPYTAIMKGPLLSMPASSLPSAQVKAFTATEINKPRHEDLFDSKGVRYGTGTKKNDDPLALKSKLDARESGLRTPPSVGFQGMPNISGFVPPDTEGAVGPLHFVQQINSTTQIFLKNGTPTGAAFNTNTLWSGFGGRCETDNSGDAIALYDEQADRWVLSQFAVGGTPELVCFAVSQTTDPTGAYHLYSVQTPRFPDYYKLGVWPATNNNAYFMGTNSGTQGAYDVFALDRENMLTGAAARPAQFFQSFPNLLMPADSDGVLPPPADAPGYLYTIRDGGEPYFGSPANDSIDIYEFDVDWITPANTTFTLAQSFTNATGLVDFNWTVCGFFTSDCIPQQGTTQLIDSNSWWPQQRLQYRNYGIYGSLVGVWGVNAVVAPAKHTAPRWFELRRYTPDTAWTIRQQGTFAPDANHRFSPSISMDESQNIGLGYSETSSAMFPGISYTVHDNDLDDLGVMEAEAEMFAGLGSQTFAARWGDYASMDVDPTDHCTFWFTTEYVASGNWRTYVGSFMVPGCKQHNILLFDDYTTEHEINVCKVDDSTNYDLALSYDFDSPTTMSVTGCPAGASCNYSASPITYPTTTTLQFTNLSAAASGAFPLTITATDGASKTDTETLTLNLQDALVTAPSLISPSNNGFSGSLTPNLSWTAIGTAQSYTVEVDNDPGFGSIDFSTTVNGLTNVDTSTLTLESCYYWRVAPANLCGNGPASVVSNFYTPGVQAQTAIASTDVPITIPTTASPTNHFSTLTVAGIGAINDVNLLNLDITHSYVGDLEMVLISPEGTSVVLMSQAINNSLCVGNNNVDISLDDEAAAGPWPCSPTGQGGVYQPTSPLSAFDGENADGDWTLNVKDPFNGDGGTINGWSLEFENFVDTGNTCPSGFTVGGSVSGLTGSGLVLQNNLGDNLAIAANGGFTFSTSLADLDPYSVTVLTQPSSPSQSCSVTNASGNIAGGNVTNVSVICTSLPDISLTGTNLTQDVCVSAGSVTATTPVTLTTTALNGYNNSIALAFNPAAPTGITGGFSNNNFTPAIAPGTDSILNLNVNDTAAIGLNTVTVQASGTGTSKTIDLGLNVISALDSAPVTSAPVNGSTGVATNATFTWAAISGASSYEIDVSIDPTFASVDFNATIATNSYTPGVALNNGTVYYWRVRAANTCGNTNYTSSAFETAAGSGVSTTEYCSAANLNIGIPENNPTGVNNILNIAPTGNIQDINIKVNISHTWVGDIIVGITSPNSPSEIVMDRPGYTGSGNGCSRNNIDTTLDDASATPVEGVCINADPTIDTGPYSPNNPLSAFNNVDLSGNWIINVSDNASGDTGTLNQWCVEAIVDTGGSLNPADYSDLNSSYGVAKHEGAGVARLGSTWSADTGFAEDADDAGDDGIIAINDWSAGSTSATLNATVNSAGFLACWFDWNNNGNFTNGEKSIAQDVILGANVIMINVPASSTFGSTGDDFLETRCRFYDTEPTIRATESPVGTATSGEVEDYRLPASSLTPVTLAYVKALAGTSTGFNLNWSTTTEAGTIAFNVHGLQNNTWKRLNTKPIAAKGVNSVVPHDYQLSVGDGNISQYKIEEITTKGKSIIYGPYASNVEHGKYPQVNPINWASIAQESRTQADIRQSLNRSNFDFVKVAVDKTGIQRITYEQLLAAGVDWQGVSADEISLSFENNALGRYVSDPVFAAGSFIEFVGVATKTLYTNTNVYVLKRDAGLVNKVVSDVSNSYLVDPSAYYMSEIRNDSDIKYSFSSPADSPWFLTSLLARDVQLDWTSPLLTPHILDNGVQSQLRFNAWGGTDFPENNDHHLQVLLNNQVVSDIVADGLVLLSDVVNVDFSLAQNLNTVTFRLPADTDSAADLIQLDAYSFEYPSKILATKDDLQFTPIVNNSSSDLLFSDGYESAAAKRLKAIAPATHGFVAKGFTTQNLNAYAFDGLNLINFPNATAVANGGTFNLSLPNVPQSGLKYFIAAQSNVIQPSLSIASNVSSPLDQPYDYLMISHPDFIDTLSALVNYHQANGLRVLVVDVNDIYAQYSHHRIDAMAIKSFIADAASQSGIKSVLLVGADSSDYLDNLGIGSISFVPTLYYPTDDIVRYTPVDALLVDTNNNLIPDLAIGRLPARTSSELQNMINKTLSFDSRNYQDTAVFASDRSAIFDSISDQMIGLFPASWQVEKAYINQLELDAAKATLISSLESGVSLTNFFGHSGPSTWSFEHLFDTDDLVLLNNLNRPSLINQFGCWSTYHVMPQYNTMAHGFMELENKGAVAVMGATTLTDSSHESLLGNHLIPLLTQSNMPVGLAIQRAQSMLAGSNPEYLDVILGWTLLGDPMLTLNKD